MNAHENGKSKKIESRGTVVRPSDAAVNKTKPQNAKTKKTRFWSFYSYSV